MNMTPTPSANNGHAAPPLSAGWHRLHLLYYAAVAIGYLVLSIFFSDGISGIDFFIALTWPACSLLVGVFGIVNGQPEALLVPLIFYAPYFLIAPRDTKSAK
jgi:hypothetical protein